MHAKKKSAFQSMFWSPPGLILRVCMGPGRVLKDFGSQGFFFSTPAWFPFLFFPPLLSRACSTQACEWAGFYSHPTIVETRRQMWDSTLALFSCLFPFAFQKAWPKLKLPNFPLQQLQIIKLRPRAFFSFLFCFCLFQEAWPKGRRRWPPLGDSIKPE